MFYSSKKIYYFFGTLLFLTFLFACETDIPEQNRTSKIFPGFKYSKVVAYDYDGSDKGDLIIEKGKVHLSVKKEVVLNQEQIEEILTILNDSLSYGGDIARCFKPHMGLVFFDENQKARAQISICFICNQHNSFPLITAQENVRNNHPNKLYGYSEKGRNKLIKLCSSLGFSNCNSNENN